MIILREFSEKDINEITILMTKLCLLKGQEFDEVCWRESLETRIKKEYNLKIIVAFNKDTEQVLGMAHFSIKNTETGDRIGVISNLIVKKDKRREGIGEMLMRQGIDYFRSNHIQSIRLALKTSQSKAAKELFAKLGFEKIFMIFELKI